MKIGFFLIAGAIVVSFIISITLTILNSDAESEEFSADSRIPLPFPKPCWTLACIISKTMSRGNSPLRPDGESFSDGIEREIKCESAERSPETRVMDIRKYVGDGR